MDSSAAPASLFVPARTFARAFLRRTVPGRVLFRRTVFRGAVLGRALFRRAIRLRLIVLLILRRGFAAARGPWGRGFLGIVGDVPPGTLELNGGSGDHLLDLAAAFRALLHHFVGVKLDFFEAVAALLAFVFVKGHEINLA